MRMRLLLVLLLLLTPGCSLFSWTTKQGDAPAGAPRKTAEQVEIEQRLARYANDVADAMELKLVALSVKNKDATLIPGIQELHQYNCALVQSTDAVSSMLGSPVKPYKIDGLPMKEVQADIKTGQGLEQQYRQTEADWKRKLDNTKAQYTVTKSKLDALSTWITWLVFAALLVVGLGQFVVCQFLSVPPKTVRAVLYGLGGVIGAIIWLFLAETIIFYGFLALLLLGVFLLVKSVAGDYIKKQFGNTVEGVQTFRVSADPATRATLDAALADAQRPKTAVDAIKAERGLPKAPVSTTTGVATTTSVAVTSTDSTTTTEKPVLNEGHV